MTPRQLNGIVAAATRSSRADFGPYHTRLRLEVRKSHIEIVRPYFGSHFLLFFRAEFIVWRTAAFAVPAVVQGENIYARRGEPFGKSVPDFALPIALMK